MFFIELHVIIIIIGFHVAYLADPGKPVRSPKRHNKSLQAQAVHYDNNVLGRGWGYIVFLKEEHDIAPDDIAQFFKILKKCQSKFDCLIFEMFFIKELKPTLNKQCDSICAKLFV